MELLWFGWLVQFALAVAYWILPRRGGKRPRSWLAVAAFIGLNLGLVVSLTGAVVDNQVVSFIGRVLVVGAVLSFIVHAWPRLLAAGTTRA